MPHTEGAKKRLRQNEKRRLRNKATKKAIKLSLRPFAEAPTDAEQLKKDGLVAVRLLDKAAAKGRIHPNKAARKKSQIARALNKAAQAPAPKK
jgi:small subunit ribosomal protein S20